MVIFMMRSAQQLAAWRRAGKYLHINVWARWEWKKEGIANDLEVSTSEHWFPCCRKIMSRGSDETQIRPGGSKPVSTGL